MSFVEVPSTPPPPGASAPVGTKMATDATLPGIVVGSPMVTAAASGEIKSPVGSIVSAQVAPVSGPIPSETSAVVVGVISRWQSSEFLTALSVVLGAGLDAAFNGILPMLAEGPVDAKAIRIAFIRSFTMGAVGAFLAWRRSTSNRVLR